MSVEGSGVGVSMGGGGCVCVDDVMLIMENILWMSECHHQNLMINTSKMKLIIKLDIYFD